MRLLTMGRHDQTRAGVVVDDEILDIAAASDALPGVSLPSSLKVLLALGDKGLRAVGHLVDQAAEGGTAERLRNDGSLLERDTVVLGPAVPDADAVICLAMNSRGHLAEMGDPVPRHPLAFQKFTSALAGSGQEIVLPPDHGDMVDWEGEFSVVIGKPCYRVSVAEAMAHVAGITLLNDVSAREFVPGFVTGQNPQDVALGYDQLLAGKNFPTFCPVGPVITTLDEFDGSYLTETLVNGEIMQSSTEDDLVMPIAETIAYLTQFYALRPGDIVSMGSPPGVGMARRPQQFLKPGDLVEVREARIGSLVNHVVASPR